MQKHSFYDVKAIKLQRKSYLITLSELVKYDEFVTKTVTC